MEFEGDLRKLLIFEIRCSDEENDEDPDSIYYLPVAPEVDDPEETGWPQEVLID